MKTNTIKWRIFKYNILVIVLLIALTTIIFNVAVRIYMEKDVLHQLDKIATRTENIALQKGPDFFSKLGEPKPPPPPHGEANDPLRFYFMLDRSLREPLSVLNADYILFDSNKNKINPPQEEYLKTPADIMSKITNEMSISRDLKKETYLNFYISGTKYIAMIKPVSEKNTFGLGWIVIYSSLEKVNQLQMGINVILAIILILSALIIGVFSSIVAKKISAPFSSLNAHIGAIAERNFDSKIHMPVDDELQDFVNNINTMSEKLEMYDKAQKTFLQNASHEFRTPLMSIQSYAEGIKYDVVEAKSAADIIIDETKRMTHLIEELLYLSRLDAIEENYHFSNLDYNELIHSFLERMNGIAVKNNIRITANTLNEKVELLADEEKLSRAITNIMNNCIRYAKNNVVITSKIRQDNKIEISISDDGTGIESSELPNIFERFYKGRKGVFGLGLAISKNIIEKHKGKISAENCDRGALFIIELPMNKI